MKSVVSERGQVTIPKEVRDRLGLRRGQEIEFEVRDGLLIGYERVAGAAGVVQSVTGILSKIDVDREINASRGPEPKISTPIVKPPRP
jgi:AbrB family looped-hinge helix DNA binding protein